MNRKKDLALMAAGILLGTALAGPAALAVQSWPQAVPSTQTFYAFLAIRVDGSSILDFLRRAACFLLLEQQYYEWRLDP